ncbi:MAG: HDOD domain-containing protein [Rubrivivax sp.]|nr:HDOD domain-containing protein [Rubrivivax sp.]
MQDHPVLGQVALGFSPIIDRQRHVVATRLTVFAEPGSTPPDALALLYLLGEVWPVSAGGGDLALTLRALDGPAASRGAAASQVATPPVSLNVADESLLGAVLAQQPGPQLMVEVPAFMAGDATYLQTLRQLQASATPMLIKGRPLAPLAPEVLACFSHAILHAGEERRVAVAQGVGARRVTTWQADVRTTADADAAFARGVAAVVGWPFDDPPPAAAGRGKRTGNAQVVLELIQGVEREDPVSRLEAVLMRDPTLAFKLMRYLNSPAFGLTVEINSFSHALMLLGYQRLKRWLALLLASSSQAPNARPMVYAAVCRGMLLEELARGRGDATVGGEMFICGLFSLLDRLLEQPWSELMRDLPVPDTVRQALCGEGGPYLPYLQLVQAIEQESAFDIREMAGRLLLSATEVNRALLMALQAARQLDG